MPFREPENAVNPVRSGGVLSLWSRSGELKSKPLSELSHVTGASRGAGCSAQFGWYRGYYSRPMERSVGRLFSSHSQEVVSISIAHRLNGLFARILRCFPLQSAQDCCGKSPCLRAKILAVRRTLLTKTASDTAPQC